MTCRHCGTIITVTPIIGNPDATWNAAGAKAGDHLRQKHKQVAEAQVKGEMERVSRVAAIVLGLTGMGNFESADPEYAANIEKGRAALREILKDWLPEPKPAEA